MPSEFQYRYDVSVALGVPVSHVALVGSRQIVGTGNDVDLLCLVPDIEVLEDKGFSPDVEVEYESSLRSYRRGDLNLIAVDDRGVFLSELAIAYGAKAYSLFDLDMRERDDRITFHQFVRSNVAQHLEAGQEDPFP